MRLLCNRYPSPVFPVSCFRHPCLTVRVCCISSSSVVYSRFLVYTQALSTAEMSRVSIGCSMLCYLSHACTFLLTHRCLCKARSEEESSYL